jgi:hypothetical protein
MYARKEKESSVFVPAVFCLGDLLNFETKEKLLTHFKYYFDISFMKEQFAVTHRYTVLQDTE